MKVRLIATLAVLVVLGGGAFVLLSPQKAVQGQDGGFTNSAQCAGCHPVMTEEVLASYHGKAFTDPEALALSKNFQDEQCISCHAPAPIFKTGVGERVFERRERREDGVDCISCHLMPDGRVAGRRGLTDAPCRPVKEGRLGAAVFCSGCHNQHWTVDEYMASRWAETHTCNDCHMPRVDRPLAAGGPVRTGVATHGFPGGHSPAMLREALKLEAEVRGGELVVRVSNVGAAHKVPTDSRHKSVNLLVTVRDVDGNLVALQEEIAEYRLYYRQQQLDSTQLLPDETREHVYALPADRSGTVLVELVYCLKPPQKVSKEWTVVHTVEVGF